MATGSNDNTTLVFEAASCRRVSRIVHQEWVTAGPARPIAIDVADDHEWLFSDPLGVVFPSSLGYIRFMNRIARCKIHDVALICPACVGAVGGTAKTCQKAKAARENGRLGGRPRKRQRKGGR